MNAPQTMTVPLGAQSYDIHIGAGLLGRIGHYIAPFLSTQRIAIITDETVWNYHGETLLKALKTAGITPHIHIRPAGESQKSFEVLQEVLDFLFKNNFSRRDAVIAFGGGVIGDLTGFACAIYKRGCHFIQIPTTLLAQVDSSIGGKTAINHPSGKNLIGAFYQPKLVLIDTSLLTTLPERELKAGYAEVLKYGLLGDADFFNWLQAHGHDVLALQTHALTHAISISCETKSDIVAKDEKEGGIRALLNLGHSFAHVLENLAGYQGDLLHGEAVSAGMLMAFEFSTALGLCPPNDTKAVNDHIKQIGLTHIDDVRGLMPTPQEFIQIIDQDKKNSGRDLTLILTHGIGKAFIEKKADRRALADYLTQYTPSPYTSSQTHIKGHHHD